MSNGSDTSIGKILMEPLKTIGAQDLLKVGYQFYGNLRKQRRVGTFLGSRRWPRKFVVISQGCVYSYKDEYAKVPQSAFSLSIYERAEASDVPHVLNCFNVINEDTTKPAHMFSCETDDKRKEWIEQLNQAIKKVHYHSGGSRSGSDEGMSMLFKRISKQPKLPPTPKTPPKGGAVPPPRKKPVSEYDLESDEDGDTDISYDEIDIKAQPKPNPDRRPKLSLPGMPSMPSMPSAEHVSELERKLSAASMRASSPLPGSQSMKRPLALPRPPTSNRPQVAPRPDSNGYVDVNIPVDPNSTTKPPEEEPEDYENAYTFEPEEYVFDSNDRTRATGYLQAKQAGTFLVRNARSGPGKVLTVQTDTLVKEFKIAEKDDGTVSLDNTEFFKNIGQMVTVYTQKSLPKKDLKLKLYKGYNS